MIHDHPVPVQQLLLRAHAAERATPDRAIGNLVGALIERLTRVVDRLHDQESPLRAEAFTALATAVDVAEALARPSERV